MQDAAILYATHWVSSSPYSDEEARVGSNKEKLGGDHDQTAGDVDMGWAGKAVVGRSLSLMVMGRGRGSLLQLRACQRR